MAITYGTGIGSGFDGAGQETPGSWDPNTIQEGESYHRDAGDRAQLGGAYGTANGLAAIYGQKAAAQQNAQLSDRYSSQEKPILDQSKQMQQDALNEQLRIANGGSTVAQQQMQTGLGQAVAAQQSAAASAGGGGPAMAAASRNAAFNSANIAGSGRNDMAALRANEMGQARDRYAQGLQGMRSQDQSLQNMGQQRDLGQQGVNDTGALGLQGMANSLQGAQLGADSSAFNTEYGADTGATNAKIADQQATRSAVTGGAIKAGEGALTAAAMMSDINAKTSIQPASAPAPWPGGATAPGVTMGQPSMPAQQPQSLGSAMPVQGMGMPQMNTLARTKMGNGASMPAGGGMISEGTKGAPRMPSIMSDEQTKFVEEKPEFKHHPLYDTNPSYLKYYMGHEPPAPGSDAVKNHNNFYHPSYADSKGSGVMSDRELKDTSHRNAADGFLDSMKPYTYRYKDPTNEPTDAPTGGHYLGVMAQNVERSPTGDTIVKDTPRGKMLEGGALMSGLAAGVGRLHERLSMLEKGKR